MSNFTFRLPPPIVGYIIIGTEFHIGLHRKPRAIHRWAMRICFGWQWLDLEQEDGK